jgi:hypothetical protein
VEGKICLADGLVDVFHRQGISWFFPIDPRDFPRPKSEKALPAMAFQRFPKFPQPLLLRFKFNLKNLLIRFSSWKNGWRLASPCCTTTQPVKKWESRANNPESPWQRIVTTPA